MDWIYIEELKSFVTRYTSLKNVGMGILFVRFNDESVLLFSLNFHLKLELKT